ncbi:MAG TPA: hypothetical protein PKY82_12650 [Pyrinomonadaceae bacterium]|nr:hypothetical protein [Pyrinomonadaceae bacterium]
MNRIKNLVSVFAFSLLVMSLPVVASAQWGGNNRNNGGYGNGGYGNGGYGNGGYYSNEQLKSTVKRLKNDSKDLAKFIDRDLDRSRYNGSRREDNINQIANDFKRAADRLESRFDSRDLYKSQSEAQQVLNIGNQLDRAISRSRLSYDIQNYWNNIERQLNEISNAYRYNNNNNRGRGNNRNNGGWGDWRNKFPF